MQGGKRMRVVHGYALETGKKSKPVNGQFKKYKLQINKQLIKQGTVMIPYNEKTYKELIEFLQLQQPDKKISYKVKGDNIIISTEREL